MLTTSISPLSLILAEKARKSMFRETRQVLLLADIAHRELSPEISNDLDEFESTVTEISSQPATSKIHLLRSRRKTKHSAGHLLVSHSPSNAAPNPKISPLSRPPLRRSPQDKLHTGSIWSIFVVIIFAKFLQYKPVQKESVVIMPEFGVQLETHYWSGRISRRFVPIGKILRPVLNECVTPVTCYWSLALILRGEEQLFLVFQQLQPPLNMLVPVWKALCAATDCKETNSS